MTPRDTHEGEEGSLLDSAPPSPSRSRQDTAGTGVTTHSVWQRGNQGTF